MVLAIGALGQFDTIANDPVDSSNVTTVFANDFHVFFVFIVAFSLGLANAHHR